MKHKICPHCKIPFIIGGGCLGVSMLGCPIQFVQGHTWFSFWIDQLYVLVVKLINNNEEITIYNKKQDGYGEFNYGEFNSDPIYNAKYLPLDFSDLAILRKKIRCWLTFA